MSVSVICDPSLKLVGRRKWAMISTANLSCSLPQSRKAWPGQYMAWSVAAAIDRGRNDAVSNSIIVLWSLTEIRCIAITCVER
jgi:hypothetical protein